MMSHARRYGHLRFPPWRHGQALKYPYTYCAVCLFAVVGCTEDHPARESKDSNAKSPVPVVVAPVQLTTLRPSIDLIGTFTAIPERSGFVAAQTSGLIKTMSVIEGATVKRGQTLIQLDPRSAKARQQRARAVVDKQQAILDRMKHGYLPQEVEIARQETLRARAELESLRLRMQATIPLHENKEVSDVEFQKLQRMVQRGEAAYAAAAAKLDLYRMGTRAEAIAEAVSQLSVAKAELSGARLAVEFCTIASPLDGVVTQLTARVGMNITPADRLATVVDLSQLFVRIRVPGSYLSRVKKGAPVSVKVHSLSNESVEGTITRFSGDADPRTGDVQAFAMVHNADGNLRPGLGCRVRVSLPPVERALAVPISAVADRNGTSVLHVVRENKAYEVAVRVGVETRDYVQITDGLSAKDVVIIEGGYGLPQGCPVKTTSKE